MCSRFIQSSSRASRDLGGDDDWVRRFAMPPKRAAGLTSSKKRPHEAPTKGRKVFAGARQKVDKKQRGGGGGGNQGRGGGEDYAGDEIDGDDDMMEGAMDDGDGDDRARRAGGRKAETEPDADEEIVETADEKRLRLAKSYLDKLRQEEAEAGGDSTDEEGEEGEDVDARNMDSHDRLANRLKNEAMHKSGRARREVARRIVFSTFGDDETETDDDETDRAGLVWRGHRLSVTGMALTSDDTTAYSVSKEGTIIEWDVETGGKTKYPKMPPVVLDPTKGGGGPMAPPRCGAAALLCCAVAKERNLLCTAGADKRIHVWDTRTMKEVETFASHRGAVTSLAIRDGTGQMFSASTDRTLKVWSLDDMAYVDTLFGHQSDVVGVAPQRRERVVTVGRDRTCRYWKVAEDSQLIFRPAPSAGQLESCAFVTPDSWITGSDDGTVSLWSTTKKRAVMSWEHVHGFGGGVRTDGDDGEITMDHGVSAPKFFTPTETSEVVSQRVAAQEMCGVSSATQNAPEGVSNAGRWVNAVAVGKGTDLCATGAGDGAIRLWRHSEDPGRQLTPLGCLPARGFVNALAVASSGRFVLAGMGQEPRGGRWARDAHAKNGILMHRLKLED